MATPCAANLNRRIVIKSLAQTKDAQGGIVDTWTTYLTVWAQVNNLSGNERKLTNSGGQVAEARTEFTIRYANVTASHKIEYNGKTYNIKHVNDYKEEHRFMILTCDTGLNNGR